MRHGKDSAGEILSEAYGLNFQSSSYFAASKVVYPALKDRMGYRDVAQCFSDRHSPGMRAIWYNLITEYNSADPSRLSRELFEKFPIYVGIRNRDELTAIRQMPDWTTYTVWIDAGDRLPPEDSSSCTISKEDADLIIENNGSFEEFREKVLKFGALYSAFRQSILSSP